MRWLCWFGVHKWRDDWSSTAGTWTIRSERCVRCGRVRIDPSVADVARRVR